MPTFYWTAAVINRGAGCQSAPLRQPLHFYIAHPRLASLPVQLFAVVTEPIVAGALTPLIAFYIAASGTRAVVVIDAPGDGFIGLTDGVEAGYVRHWITALRLN